MDSKFKDGMWISSKSFFFSILFIFVSIIFVILDSSQVFAIEFTNQKLENYVISLTVNGKDVNIKQSFEIVSTSDKPIVPGYAKLVLFEGADPKNIIVNVGGSTKKIDSYELLENRPVIYYDIWRPLASGERLSVTVDFDMLDYVKTGLFFQEISMQIGSSFIPVDSVEVILNLPKGKYLSHTTPRISNLIKSKDMNSYSYDVVSGSVISAEFSSIPLPILPFNGYWMWSGFAVLCLVFFAIQVINAVKHIKNSN